MTDFRTLLLALGASLLGVGTVVAQTTTPSADGRSDEVALRPAGITGSLATDPAGNRKRPGPERPSILSRFSSKRGGGETLPNLEFLSR